MKKRAIGGHQSSRMVSDVWLTPREILWPLGPFDLDPCAPSVRPWETAGKHFSLPLDGLLQPWEGRVWLNPPYSREAVKWLRKIAKHGNGTALVFARTETAWFVESIWKRADAILFLEGRVTFRLPDGTKAAANSGAPSVLVAYGENNVWALEQSGIPGFLVKDWRRTGASHVDTEKQ